MEEIQEDELIRGDSVIIEFSLKDENKQNIEPTELNTLILTAKDYIDGDILFSKDKNSFDYSEGRYSIELLPEDTQALNIKSFVFDIEATLPDGTRKTLLGKINLIFDVTTHEAGVDNEN